jgi:hypothetical protein
LFSNNSVNNDPDNADEDEEEDEDDSYKGEDDLDDGKSTASFICDGPDNNENVHHVHVVMNHNPQEESMAINVTSLSTTLPFYDPPLDPFSKFVSCPWK